MKLLFICGSLEEKKSGVADFVIRLARSLIAKGVQCTCISIHDHLYVSSSASPFRGNIHGLDLIRIPDTFDWNSKSQIILGELESFKPDWISLQFVPYAFNANGFPFELVECLTPFKSFANWSVMFHELWVDPSLSIKHFFDSYRQRKLITCLLNSLNPSLVHTSNFWYQKLLRDIDISSNILPIFSSIDYISQPSDNEVDGSRWDFILFGSINKDWKPLPLLKKIYDAQTFYNISKCSFVAIGNIGSYGTRLWDGLNSARFPNFSFQRTGELPAKSVSKYLQNADFGLCLSPSHLVEKSSAVAAMISHGTPVIISRVSSNSYMWNQQLKESNKYILLDKTFVSSLGSVSRFKPFDRTELVSTEFYNSLNKKL